MSVSKSQLQFETMLHNPEAKSSFREDAEM